jgi:hypothetical protein
MHSVLVVLPTLRQPTGDAKNPPSDLPLFGWGFILILVILSCRYLIICLYQKQQSNRSATLLQRQAALERLLAYKLPPQQLSRRRKFQQY